jgi:hypothetical protein
MSAANTGQLPVVPPVTTAHVTMWEDTSVELNDQRIRQNIPDLPRIDVQTEVYYSGGIESLSYFALQILKSNDKLVIIRALASATAILTNQRVNFTGSSAPPVIITGLERDAWSQAQDSDLLNTNFTDAEDVRVSELLDMMEADVDELGAYFGLLYLAGNKPVTNKNRTAFNERRQSAALASIISDPRIFVADSVFLSDTVLKKVYASFLSYLPLRSHMISSVVQLIGRPFMGSGLAFMNMFLLLADFGMGALRIIKEAVLKHPWIRTDFPELKPELEAVNKAQQIIRRVPGEERSFLKAIHGNNFVPVNYAQIDNLTGVCREVLKRTTPSYASYGGGKITADQMARIVARLGVEGVNEATQPVSAE